MVTSTSSFPGSSTAEIVTRPSDKVNFAPSALSNASSEIAAWALLSRTLCTSGVHSAAGSRVQQSDSLISSEIVWITSSQCAFDGVCRHVGQLGVCNRIVRNTAVRQDSKRQWIGIKCGVVSGLDKLFTIGCTTLRERKRTSVNFRTRREIDGASQDRANAIRCSSCQRVDTVLRARALVFQ